MLITLLLTPTTTTPPLLLLLLRVKFEPKALFAIHLEIATTDGNTCRVSVGNIFKPENLKKKSGCVQYNLRDPPSTWALLSLDLPAAAAEVAGPAAAATAARFSHLKSIQMCSTLTVRGAFTSDLRFGLTVGCLRRI